ncbi:von Willebrand factor type A domain-containing protein [Mucilaginibacter calamicampi]|uniref:von Willebrand factor type A domain-containing protein n=1 Tax=Mucilaginibacter calamicampi TaxID=1302352 RepID=A0ABW2Z049_9SPHI
MRTYLIALTAAVCLTQVSPNAPRNINGIVYDSLDKKSMAGVTVTVEGNKKPVYTDSKGHYTIAVPGNKSRLIFSAIGYKSDTLLPGKTNTLNVYLKPMPVIYKADTAAYAANNYKVKSNASVSEMIKKIEGFEVDANGNVTFQGQPVTKVRLTGKDYTGGDAAQALQSLPSDIIEHIQVIDDYGNSAGKTGIKSGEPTKVLNLTNTKNSALNEVVVTGYGVQKKAAVVGSVTTINPTAISAPPAMNQLRGVVNRIADNNESYSPIVENQFINPTTTPLSTLATDVDAASYANVRRYINSGQLPPKNAVRIEEMINYFKYDLSEPKAGKPVAIQAEVTNAPWNAKHQLVRIGLKAKTIDNDKLPPSNLVFLLDVSGSMDSPNKLPLVKTSLKMLVDQLRNIDHVAMVVYAGAAGLVLPSTPGDQKQKIKDAIDQLGAGGSTAGGVGLKLAYNIARQNFKKGGNNRIVMATDGDFNVGQSSDKDMEGLIEQERQSGVSISILGFGMGNYKDSKMELLADKGHGNYAYIDNVTEATRCMVTEFGGTLFTVAKDVKLQVEFNPAKVQAYRLLGYEDRLLAKEDFNNDAKLGGDMGVGHNVTALYEIIPAGVKDDAFSASVDPLKYQKEQNPAIKNASDELMTVKFRYKDPHADVSKMESIVIQNKTVELNNSTEDMRFAAAVAEYGLLLRNSQFKQSANFNQVITLAKNAKGKDEQGYRAEFIRLAESTRDMAKSNTLAAE